MRLHSNAKTCPNQRLLIKHSSLSCALLADRFGVSKSTICRWKHRDDPNDRSCRPRNIGYAIGAAERLLLLFLRRLELPIDEILAQLSELLPLKRATVCRLFAKEGLGRLPKRNRQPEASGRFGNYEPGYLHIDSFCLPCLEGKKRYAFVAVDRATRLTYLAVYDKKDKQAGADFLSRCLGFFAFRIVTVLTDNGSEFTNANYKKRQRIRPKSEHPFSALCRNEGIEHRRTRPYTPRTNGMAERMVGVIKAATLNRYRYPSAQAMIDSLNVWMLAYNFERKHRRLGLKTPYQAASDWYQKKPELFIREPASLLRYRSQRRET